MKVKINADNFKLNACDDSLTKTVMIQHLKNSIIISKVGEFDLNEYTRSKIETLV